MTTDKIVFRGLLKSIQPRIRLTRSFDQRSHSYLGYALRIDGSIESQVREFTIGIGKGAQEKHAFQAGPVRKVPGRQGMTWVEEDWVDEEAVSHREPDE